MVALYDEHKRWVGEKENGVSLSRLGHNVRLPAWLPAVAIGIGIGIGFRLWQGIEAVIEIFAHMTIAILDTTKAERGRENESGRWEAETIGQGFSFCFGYRFFLCIVFRTHTHSELSFCVFISIYDEIHVTQYLFLARTPKKKQQSSVLECDIPMTIAISAKRFLCCILCRKLSL